ncbi:MAG: RagB/SusD family nutrient uptake outer membrane protein [Bacteroidales bacterium]|nr:RagB/SusD family nutrient uptake outer membrane protein [Bacteroidales bacterium]
MKRNIFLYSSLLLGMAVSLSSCNDWLGEDSPGSTQLPDFFTSGEACIQTINGCYAPLAWDYGTTYFPEYYIGDIVSDDAVKGGQNLADGNDLYDLENFKTNANNAILLNYYRAKFDGIARCNLALREVGAYEPDETLSEGRHDALMGEAHFLRALYYFQLVRVFGGVPKIDFVVDSATEWKQPRATAEDIYELIVSDLEKAESLLPDKNSSVYASEDLGRATRGAAQALLCKVYLYQHEYNEAYEWGKKFVDTQYKAGVYALTPHFYDIFTLAGENGPDSVFEIQYVEDPMSDYGGFGFTRGTFGQILTRPRLSSLGSNSGWGFDHPTQNLYDEFESGDIRREVAIGVPAEGERDEAEVNYLGVNYYYNRKVSWQDENGTFPTLAHASRGPLNYPLIRTSDALLLFAEAALESGKSNAEAKWALEEVRRRARQDAGQAGVLPEFPNYRGYSDNTESLRQAIRHERRVELAMEGHRWFDLVRWGIAAQVMDPSTGSYGSTEAAPIRQEMAAFITGKHELFPLPSEEIQLNPMPQNPGY